MTKNNCIYHTSKSNYEKRLSYLIGITENNCYRCMYKLSTFYKKNNKNVPAYFYYKMAKNNESNIKKERMKKRKERAKKINGSDNSVLNPKNHNKIHVEKKDLNGHYLYHKGVFDKRKKILLHMGFNKKIISDEFYHLFKSDDEFKYLFCRIDDYYRMKTQLNSIPSYNYPSLYARMIEYRKHISSESFLERCKILVKKLEKEYYFRVNH